MSAKRPFRCKTMRPPFSEKLSMNDRSGIGVQGRVMQDEFRLPFGDLILYE
ncbi:hypothetical protein OKW43_005879 [Paraburkholderia sp. WC7.3g]|uniref:hypothetical protein n=1 Tax=Paraburkholderia TaxID=1822464 RepID=UPI0016566E2D|nr:hypothetical protein [Paraburkholderia podalyriae]